MITVTRCYNQTKCKVFCELRNYYKMKRAQVVTPDFHCSSGSKALSPVLCSQGYPLSHEKHKTLLFTPSLPNYGPFSVFTFLSQKSQKELFFSVPSNALVTSLICLFKFKLTQLKMKKNKNSVTWSHQPHLKCSRAACGQCQHVVLASGHSRRTLPSLPRVLLGSAGLDYHRIV